MAKKNFDQELFDKIKGNKKSNPYDQVNKKGTNINMKASSVTPKGVRKLNKVCP